MKERETVMSMHSGGREWYLYTISIVIHWREAKRSYCLLQVSRLAAINQVGSTLQCYYAVGVVQFDLVPASIFNSVFARRSIIL